MKKRNPWRPLKWETPEILEKEIEKYFTDTPKEEWTITGLALALDTSRETLCNYEDSEGSRADFFDTIKNAKLRVHNEYEKDLRRKGRSGDIFALKNFGWTDRQEFAQEHSGAIAITWQNDDNNSISEASMADEGSST